MFTGLIEAVGRLAAIHRSAAGVSVEVETALALELAAGDSVSVGGICLTVTGTAGGAARFDLGTETLRVTTAGGWREGRSVNLERAMRADARFGGHFVQGHVDGTGTVRGVRAEGDSRRLTIAVPRSLLPYLVAKGSVAVDGVSLTVAALADDQFDVMIVPFTWAHTTLASLQAGDAVNLECDMIGKYVARALTLMTTRAT
jgi:riboflavin synthase alpha subunit